MKILNSKFQTRALTDHSVSARPSTQIGNLSALVSNIKPDIRFLNDMREVIYDKKWLKTAPNLELYYMYRGVKEKKDLRYDITLIPAKMLGREFVKTKGHEHIGKYQEIYIIMDGEAIFLLQKREKDEIKDVYAVKAKKNDVVVIPSFYGHITINPSKKTLKMANWIYKECKSDYQPILEKQGACYYYIKSARQIGGDGWPASNASRSMRDAGWIKNNNYKKIPKLRFEKPLKSLPKDLSFLKK